MTDYQTQLDIAGIRLPEEGEPPLREHLQLRQKQLDHLVQAVTEIMPHLHLHNVPALPPPESLLMTPPWPRTVGVNHALLPECYGGDPVGCRNFLLTCKLYFREFRQMTARQWTLMVIQWLTGHAQDWAVVVWSMGGVLAMEYDTFVQEFKAVFNHPNQGQSSAQRLLHLHKGSSSVADYSIQFCILTAGSSWNEPALVALFRMGLSTEIVLELSCTDADLDLNGCISLAIQLDQYLRGNGYCPCSPPQSRGRGRSRDLLLELTSKPCSQLGETHQDPMEVGMSRLPAEERQRRLDQGLCLYCDTAGQLVYKAQCIPFLFEFQRFPTVASFPPVSSTKPLYLFLSF